MPIKIYDTTLRDGAQQEGLSFSVADKLKIAQKLIDFGIGYIEGGFPGSNPKDAEFFKEAKKLKWGKSKLVAFCPTRHKKNKPQDDPSLKAILESGVKHVTVFGKAWDLHSEKILEISEKENLELISSTISFLTKKGLTVFFDAEHFFDGFKDNPNFAIKCLEAAQKAGAKNLSLCDTNGGTLPWEVEEITKKVCKKFPKTSIGIHTHNDSGMAEANSIAAVHSGADFVQGTINGFGERTGNANLCAVLPNLALKMKIAFDPKIDLKKLFSLASFVAEVANTNHPKRAPFVGLSTFTHKAGLHVSAVNKLTRSYEHINPELVGNTRKITVSELSGSSNIAMTAKSLGIDLDKNSDITKRILAKVKKMESEGFVFEGADASFKLLVLRETEGYKPPFEIIDFLILNKLSRELVEAEVQVRIGKKVQTEISFGNGPVDAPSIALKKALLPYFPVLENVRLSDYKVRIIDSRSSTAAKTRVLIESKMGDKTWTTVGCDENIITASMHALADSLEYTIVGIKS